MIYEPGDFVKEFYERVGTTPVTYIEERVDAHEVFQQLRTEIGEKVDVRLPEWQNAFDVCQRFADAHARFPVPPSERVFLGDGSERAQYLRRNSGPISKLVHVGPDGRRYYVYGGEKHFLPTTSPGGSKVKK
jgi:hypothetical protein